ncbi:MAG: hypothetical protein EOO77_16780 [Oxalobacteraceae bacterium]|nr:MAG: hypothetical protein EOO77_16780 [Oxalobacteraceae bacterium]
MNSFRYEIFLRDPSNHPLGYMHYNVRAARGLSPEQVEQIIIDHMNDPFYNEATPKWSTLIIWGPRRRYVLTWDQVQRMRK